MKVRKWDASDIQSQKGKIAIVTGSSSGIGYEAARVLALKDAKVIIAVRNREKGADAIQQIRNQYSGADVELMILDLASLESVKKFADAYKSKFDRLDILINNAGVMIPPYSKTQDGFELQFGTNHLGHFALTGQLIDLIEKTPDSRIVNVSSAAHNYGKINFNDLAWERRKYRPWTAYGDSKIANLYFTYSLGDRIKHKKGNTIVAAAHPGWTATELQRNSGPMEFLNKLFAQSIEMGALPTLYAALGPDVKTGDYYGPSGFMEMKGYPKKVSSNERSHKTEIAGKLWNVSEELTKVRFNN